MNRLLLIAILFITALPSIALTSDKARGQLKFPKKFFMSATLVMLGMADHPQRLVGVVGRRDSIP